MANRNLYQNTLLADSKYAASAGTDGLPKPILLGRLDISGGLVNANGWSFGQTAGAVNSKQNDGTYDYIKVAYPDDTVLGVGPWSQIRFTFPSRGETDIYLQFWSKKTAGGGSKFVKFYGQDSGGNQVANATFGMIYSNGEIGSISYGDGTTTTNDTQCRVDTYNDGDQSGRSGALTRSFVNGGTFTSSEWNPSSTWHKFQLRIKYNTGTTAGNETNNGEVIEIIDGVTRIAGYNIYNRHYSNLPLDYVEFASYTQNAAAFDFGIRNITVSKNGWID